MPWLTIVAFRSTRTSVSFIAISNHVLDAAKSNRCVCLLRSEPDPSELESIAEGCLFDEPKPPRTQALQGLPAGLSVTVGDFVTGICGAYTKLLNDDGAFAWFERFFGLRDFIHTLKLLRRTSLIPSDVIRALERNFNGCQPQRFHSVLSEFMHQIYGSEANLDDMLDETKSNLILDILHDALADRAGEYNPPRYKLILDETNDDSMMRLLRDRQLLGLEENAEIHKLSDFPE